MANDGEIRIDTRIDESGLDKGLKSVKDKIKNLDIDSVKSKTKDTLESVKNEAKSTSNELKKGTKSVKNEIKGTSKEIKKGEKATNALKTVFNETGGAAAGFAGKMESLATSGGAVAAGITAAILAAKKYIETLKQANEAYKVQEKAENALQKAAENNPYLNRESVQRLKDYASEIQSASNFGDEGTIDVMAQLAASGRSESEIMKLVAAAADYAAAKHISLESAVQNLNKSYGGLAGELGELFPEVKALTTEQLKNGEAVDIIAAKYKGFAKEAADSSTQAKNAFGDFMESVGKIANPFFEGLNQRAKSFWESMTAQMSRFNDVLETASRKWGIGGTKRSVDEGVNLINTEFQDSQTGKMRGAEEVQTKEYLEWLNQELEIRNKINGTLTSEEMQALVLIKSEIRKRNEIEKAAKAEEKAAQAKAETAVKTKEAQKTADDYAKKSNKSLEENLHALEVEAKAKGEAVSAQDKYNVYLQSYIDLLTKTEGAIKEGYPVEQKRLEQLKEAKKAVDEAADEEEKLAAAIQYTQAATDALNSGTKNLTPAEELGAEIKQLDELKAKIEAMSDAEVSAAQDGADEQLSKSEIIAGLNEAEKQATLAKVDAITATEESWWDKYANHQEQLLEMKKAVDESEVLSEEEKIKALKDLDEEYSKSRKQQFAELATQIKGYTDQAVGIMNQAADLMLAGVKNQSEAEQAELEEKYNKGEISEEEYNKKVTESKKKAAREQYKIQMWQWSASILQATANIAQGVTQAIAQGGVLGLITGVMVGAAGAVQVASVIASKPVPPSFSTGGIVGGSSTHGDNIATNLNSREMVMNMNQQKGLWDFINGGSRQGNGANIVINNSAANLVSARPQITKDKIELLIDARVNEGLKSGRYNNSLNMAQQSMTGDYYGI